VWPGPGAKVHRASVIMARSPGKWTLTNPECVRPDFPQKEADNGAARHRPLTSVMEPALAVQNGLLTRRLEQAALDATALTESAQLQVILTEEIHHRMKNMLTMVAAIVRQSMRSATDMREAEVAIGTRLMAMAKAHDLLLQANLKSASLSAIVQGATEQHDTATGRISVGGVDMEIQPSSILPLTLALNELCTNATKYGALSVPRGRVTLTWTLDGDGSVLILRWLESDGPAVLPPRLKSLGSKLLEMVLPDQLGGRAQLNFHPSGFEYELAVPMARLGALKPLQGRK
jgi:two-component sensor histidine kinase